MHAPLRERLDERALLWNVLLERDLHELVRPVPDR